VINKALGICLSYLIIFRYYSVFKEYGAFEFRDFVPLLLPVMQHYGWNSVWFGVLLTLQVALGQFTPPLAVNLMVACRIAGVHMESTIRWVVPLLVAMLVVLLAVVAFPPLALWLPARLGY